MAKNNDVRCARGVLRRAYIVMEVHHFECARIRQIVKSRRIVKKTSTFARSLRAFETIRSRLSSWVDKIINLATKELQPKPPE